jgi:hypothetical protein
VLLVSIRVDTLGTLKGVTGAENLFKFLSLGVEINPVLHFFREIGIRIDGLYRTLVDTGIAVDAGIRIDIKSVRRLMKSVNRADSHTGGEFAVNTRFSYNVSHGVLYLVLLEYKVFQILGFFGCRSMQNARVKRVPDDTHMACLIKAGSRVAAT